MGFLGALKWTCCEKWSGAARRRREMDPVLLKLWGFLTLSGFFWEMEIRGDTGADREAEMVQKKEERTRTRRQTVIKRAVSKRPGSKTGEEAEQTSPLLTAMADKMWPLVWNRCRRLNEMFWGTAGEMANQQEREQLACSLTALCATPPAASPLRASTPLCKRRDRI